MMRTDLTDFEEPVRVGLGLFSVLFLQIPLQPGPMNATANDIGRLQNTGMNILPDHPEATGLNLPAAPHSLVQPGSKTPC